MARVEALPHEYRYVFKKIQERMWMFAAGAGYDMMKIHADLLELFESGAADGKRVLEITGEDVAAFCDELLRGPGPTPRTNARRSTAIFDKRSARSICRGERPLRLPIM